MAKPKGEKQEKKLGKIPGNQTPGTPGKKESAPKGEKAKKTKSSK